MWQSRGWRSKDVVQEDAPGLHSPKTNGLSLDNVHLALILMRATCLRLAGRYLNRPKGLFEAVCVKPRSVCKDQRPMWSKEKVLGEPEL